ncbi:class II aldolase/adducin family protein [Brachybacterium paraconglomeratum]|uniref:class II aldolase/adducin family protein n=1 Tax=Brachybacterium paraconglomeratum TaxID=173362 RepID=UPI0035157C71
MPESGPKASKEMAMYRRFGAGVVVHTHSFHAVQASCLPPWAGHCAVPPDAPYFAMTIGNLPLSPYRHPGDPTLGDLLDERELDFRAALLSHHGLILYAERVDAAIAATVEIDEACRLAVSLAPSRKVSSRSTSSGSCCGALRSSSVSSLTSGAVSTQKSVGTSERSAGRSIWIRGFSVGCPKAAVCWAGADARRVA